MPTKIPAATPVQMTTALCKYLVHKGTTGDAAWSWASTLTLGGRRVLESCIQYVAGTGPEVIAHGLGRMPVDALVRFLEVADPVLARFAVGDRAIKAARDVLAAALQHVQAAGATTVDLRPALQLTMHSAIIAAVAGWFAALPPQDAEIVASVRPPPAAGAAAAESAGGGGGVRRRVRLPPTEADSM